MFKVGDKVKCIHPAYVRQELLSSRPRPHIFTIIEINNGSIKVSKEIGFTPDYWFELVLASVPEKVQPLERLPSWW